MDSGLRKEERGKHGDLSALWCRAQLGLQQVRELENHFDVEKPQKESLQGLPSDSLQSDRVWTGGKQLCSYICTVANCSILKKSLLVKVTKYAYPHCYPLTQLFQLFRRGPAADAGRSGIVPELEKTNEPPSSLEAPAHMPPQQLCSFVHAAPWQQHRDHSWCSVSKKFNIQKGY